MADPRAVSYRRFSRTKRILDLGICLAVMPIVAPILIACAIALVGASGSAAFAGEITGNGKPTQGPAHANSICVFSGLNDYINGQVDKQTQTPADGPPGAPGHGIPDTPFANGCRGGSNPDRLP